MRLQEPPNAQLRQFSHKLHFVVQILRSINKTVQLGARRLAVEICPNKLASLFSRQAETKLRKAKEDALKLAMGIGCDSNTPP